MKGRYSPRDGFSNNEQDKTILRPGRRNKPIVRMLKREEVTRITSLSRSGIYKKIADGEFPKQVRLGKRSVAWMEDEIVSWMDDKIKESRR